MPSDPALARRLARRLDEGLADVVTDWGPTGGPVVVTKGGLARVLACPAHGSPPPPPQPLPPTFAVARGALVDAVFRQWVTLGEVDDALSDGLAALRIGGRHDHLLAWIAELGAPERTALAAEVQAQADGLRQRWPRLAPTWLPRTQEPLRVLVGGGAFELSARVDLALGMPGGTASSVALVEVKAGAPRAVHRDDLRLAALVEGLRHSAPPFALATYYARSGELDVEWVGADVLTSAIDRVVVGARLLWDERYGRGRDRPPPGMCSACRPEASDVDRADGRGPDRASLGQAAA